MYAGQLEQIPATLGKSRLPVAGHNLMQRAFRGKDHVQQKIRIQHGAGFLHVFGNPVALQDSRFRCFFTTGSHLVRQRHQMVMINGIQSRHARQDSFAAAAKTGERMQGDTAGHDNFISLGHHRVQIDRRAVFRGPVIF